MRKFKHKITGNTAIETHSGYNYRITNPQNFTIPKWIVENSCDWEEIKEELPIGTKVKDTNPETYGYIYEKLKNGKWKIGSQDYFTISENSIREGKRFQIVKEKPVLFFTEDGKEIREGDEYYYVLEPINNCIMGKNNCTKFGISLNRKGVKYFSVKEAAENYIILNKPCLSIKDLKNTFPHLNKIGEDIIKLKQLVKSKL